MAKTIPQLTDATTVNAADELIIQQGGITKRATGSELAKGLNNINSTVNVKDFGAVLDGVADDTAAFAAAITAAAAGNYAILVPKSCTVKIPSAAITLQIALDRLVPSNPGVLITLEIEAGHTLTAGASLNNSDKSQFRITAVDAEVAVSFNGNILAGNNSNMPILACLINAQTQTSGSGVRLEASKMFIEPNCGVKNTHGSGLAALYGSKVRADDTIWSGAARNGTTGSGITSWGSLVSAERANCTNSGYYGAQAAHGGILAFRRGDASNAHRHGIRATDAAIVDADGAKANDCGADLSGSNVRAYEGGIVNFVRGEANGNKATASNGAALFAFGAGASINARIAASTGNARSGARAQGGAIIRLTTANVAGSVVNFEEIDGVIARGLGSLSGVYTPTLFNTLNISSSTASEAIWSRIGDTVTVSGNVTIETTSSGNTTLEMTLPIASNFVAARDCGGSAMPMAFKTTGYFAVHGDATTDRVFFRTNASAGDSAVYAFIFKYRIR